MVLCNIAHPRGIFLESVSSLTGFADPEVTVDEQFDLMFHSVVWATDTTGTAVP